MTPHRRGAAQHEAHARSRRRRADSVAAGACAEPEGACRSRRHASAERRHASCNDHGAVDIRHGRLPREHGIVANGWYFRDLAEVWLWRQSNHLVGGEKIWDAAKRLDPSFTCAKLFWWYNMYSTADFSVTPRPMYPADGRKLPDIYTHPPSFATNCSASWASSRCFASGDPQPTSSQRAGSDGARCTSSSVTARP